MNNNIIPLNKEKPSYINYTKIKHNKLPVINSYNPQKRKKTNEKKEDSQKKKQILLKTYKNNNKSIVFNDITNYNFIEKKLNKTGFLNNSLFKIKKNEENEENTKGNKKIKRNQSLINMIESVNKSINKKIDKTHMNEGNNLSFIRNLNENHKENKKNTSFLKKEKYSIDKFNKYLIRNSIFLENSNINIMKNEVNKVFNSLESVFKRLSKSKESIMKKERRRFGVLSNLTSGKHMERHIRHNSNDSKNDYEKEKDLLEVKKKLSKIYKNRNKSIQSNVSNLSIIDKNKNINHINHINHIKAKSTRLINEMNNISFEYEPNKNPVNEKDLVNKNNLKREIFRKTVEKQIKNKVFQGNFLSLRNENQENEAYRNKIFKYKMIIPSFVNKIGISKGRRRFYLIDLELEKRSRKCD